MTAESFEQKLPTGLVLRGLRWNAGAKKKVLAIHGWLDNANSFLPMAPFLPDDIELLAIDLAGHGLSDHRTTAGWYYLVDFVRDIGLLVDALQWQSFALLGHSLGGAISCMTTAALPDRVQALAVVEGLGPLSGEPQQAAVRLRESLNGLRQADNTRLRRHANPEAAAQARLKTNRMLPASAQLIVERGLQRLDDGWVWRTDPLLRTASPIRFTESEVLYMLGGIQCPVLQIMPNPPAVFISMPHIQRRAAMIKDYRQVEVKGHHHVHMDDPETCASALFPFLLNR